MNLTPYKLGDICRMKYGKMPPSNVVADEGYPIFSGYRITGCAKEYLYDEPRVIVVARGVGGTGDVKMSPEKSWITNLSIVLDHDEGIVDKKFLLYRLGREPLKEKLNTGAAQAQITIDSLSAYSITLPPVEAQRRIASIITAYDDLIENNRRRIQLLEQAARLLYKEWFVHLRFPGHEHTQIIDGVPKGWVRLDLEQIATIFKGKNITKETIKEGDIPVVAGGLKPAYYHNEANTSGPVITVSASGANSGYVSLYHRDIWASDCSYLSSADNPEIWFLYLLMKSRQSEITGMQQGAAQPHVYPKHLKRLGLLYPPRTLRKFFHETVEASFRKIANLEKQIEKLTRARDLLLPKLMNGEVAV